MTETAYRELVALADDAHPYETGGILVGVQSDDYPWITQALELKGDNASKNRFRLEGDIGRAAVDSVRAGDARLGYLGDWHSHPFDVSASPRDLAALEVITAAEQGEPLSPFIVVVRRTARGQRLDVLRHDGDGVLSCDIVVTGELPPSNARPR
ncbi:MAG: Mov34/MPN/PAD-1 family protein [Chloroflexi bacterium]|nr:Mov34/MPN/PAD-1 family protein [Chloroflexota bacterium]MDA1147176.1 Mov34/MPN/PAD-1 family protein [Chloroflexota bacterium]